jgi:hypothetical protein
VAGAAFVMVWGGGVSPSFHEGFYRISAFECYSYVGTYSIREFWAPFLAIILSLPNSVVNKICFVIFSDNNVALYVKCNFLKHNMAPV